MMRRTYTVDAISMLDVATHEEGARRVHIVDFGQHWYIWKSPLKRQDEHLQTLQSNNQFFAIPKTATVSNWQCRYFFKILELLFILPAPKNVEIYERDIYLHNNSEKSVTG